ncbi:MAG: hypothetical protein HHJ16_11820 [Polaromonas sp.]|uniref:hypothetical protein n=1 Tax=Polaromonas sp. TaxID=1869339 RepID=UPI001846EB58|nr:hypothetical protein [Polaromonas sp.]NMM10943.1 hypothetical protein [Polaromonas sp.]
MVTKKLTAKTAPSATLAKNDTPATEARKKLAPHEVVLSSNIQNTIGIQSWGKFAGDISSQALADDLDVQTKKVQDGDMRPIEGMLYRQAKTLETIFASLARRAAGNESLKQFQVNLSLALKAQAQCRSTLEALAEIKNPRPVSFVKQANIAHGPQLVNNGAQPLPRTETFESEPNKLLEADYGQRMVIGAQGQTVGVNQAVETLAEIHRP